MVNIRDSYQPQMVAAARLVLLELADLLEDERDHIVFVGGTACALLFPQETDPHKGTIDVDIALDPVRLAEYGTDTLEEKLICANFQQDAPKAGEEVRNLKKYRWFRSALIAGSGSVVEVAVDLLCGEYDTASATRGRGKRRVFTLVFCVGWIWRFLIRVWCHCPVSCLMAASVKPKFKFAPPQAFSQ